MPRLKKKYMQVVPGATSPGPEREYMTLKQAGEYLGYSRTTIWRFIKHGNLRVLKIQPWKVKRTDLDALFEKLAVKENPK